MQLAAGQSGKRRPEPSKTDLMAKKQALDSVEESKKRIAACKKHLAELVAKAGRQDGAPSPANS
jgi:hypothetical protein